MARETLRFYCVVLGWLPLKQSWRQGFSGVCGRNGWGKQDGAGEENAAWMSSTETGF